MKLEKLAQDWFAAWQAANPDSRRTAQSYQGDSAPPGKI